MSSISPPLCLHTRSICHLLLSQFFTRALALKSQAIALLDDFICLAIQRSLVTLSKHAGTLCQSSDCKQHLLLVEGVLEHSKRSIISRLSKVQLTLFSKGSFSLWSMKTQQKLRSSTFQQVECYQGFLSQELRHFL